MTDLTAADLDQILGRVRWNCNSGWTSLPLDEVEALINQARQVATLKESIKQLQVHGQLVEISAYSTDWVDCDCETCKIIVKLQEEVS